MCLKQQDMVFLPAQLEVSPIKMGLGPNKNGSLAINRAGIHYEARHGSSHDEAKHR
jgi:hypothetical protein